MALCYVEGLVKLLTEEIKKEVLAKNVSKKARKIECYFLATKVLAKHDEKYMPKENNKIIEDVATTTATTTAIVAMEGPKTP
ncbi:Cytochrome c-type biogenesis protein CcmE, mitochondrial [Glycine max]|nr:Cytochrome c-type biogenesis protein CcmE, mitochondrial [Glycine max]